MNFSKKLSAIAASTALALTGFTPAMAVPLNPAPHNFVSAPASVIDMASLGWSADGDKAENWRGYRGHRGYRGYRGYGYGRGYRHRDRIDAGDVLAGVLIIGGIAAIANAASKNDRSDDRYDRPNNDRRYDDRSYDNSRNDRGTGSMDMAINVCSDAAERQAGDNARVSGIESVERDGNGWRVEGDLSGSDRRTFLCGATDGRVDFVQLDGSGLAFAD